MKAVRYFCFLIALGCLWCSGWGTLEAQTSTLSTVRGVVSDPTGAVIPGADVILYKGTTQFRKGSTNEVGAYAISAPPGTYAMRVTSVGFTPVEFKTVNLSSAPLEVNAQLKLASETQQVEVNETVQGVSLEASNNLGAVVLKGEDLEALSDNPEDLETELQALAGPSAGPNGGQIFVDGFSGGRLPPKSAIREIRINQNPYAAEFDRVGFGRIEILTKPGADKLRGQAFFNFGDESLNTRNPYSAQRKRPPYQQRFFGGNIGGPLGKRSSFFFELERRDVDESSLINATTLDTNFNLLPVSGFQATPQRRWSINPRWDYAINDKNTLIVRYAGEFSTNNNQGVGAFSLPSRAFNTTLRDHTFQISETMVLSPRLINEIRVQYIDSRSGTVDPTTNPGINVLEAFTGGGAQAGNGFSQGRRVEIQEYLSYVRGKHSIKAGGRIRPGSNENVSLANYGGTYIFGSAVGPLLDANFNPIAGTSVQLSSIERYQRAQILLSRGFTGADLVARGAAPSQFSITAGQSGLTVDQTDVGLFAQDDWKFSQRLTISGGLRWESQTNINDHSNFAPRLGFAYGIDGGAKKQAKTILRVNAGIFYDRFSDGLVLGSRLNNGTLQQQYQILTPNFYPVTPTAALLSQFAAKQNQTIRGIDRTLQAPKLYQSSVSVERALPKNSSVSVVFLNTRGTHQLRTRNINAPINGVRPFAGVPGNLLSYESTGYLDQRQILTFVRTTLSKNLSMFGFYSFGHTNGDTDGAGSNPANPYDLSTEYSRSSFDIRHRLNVFGNYTTIYKIHLSPILSVNSGGAFNITTGRDNNGDGQFTDRPSITTDATLPGVVRYRGVLLNPNPKAGEAIIARNFGKAPGSLNLNLRLTRTWGFGPENQAPAGAGGGFGGPPGFGGPRGGGGGRGGPGGGGGGGPFGGGDTTNRRYNMTLSVSANNILNHVNPGTPTGNIGSPFFGQSLSSGGFGGFGPRGGGGAFSQAGNRRIEAQLRFSF